MTITTKRKENKTMIELKDLLTKGNVAIEGIEHYDNEETLFLEVKYGIYKVDTDEIVEPHVACYEIPKQELLDLLIMSLTNEQKIRREGDGTREYEIKRRSAEMWNDIMMRHNSMRKERDI